MTAVAFTCCSTVVKEFQVTEFGGHRLFLGVLAGAALIDDRPLPDDFELMDDLAQEGVEGVRSRHLLKCESCGCEVPARGERLSAVLRQLDAKGVASVDLDTLRRMLTLV